MFIARRALSGQSATLTPSIGLKVNDVDYVMCTHLHVDHVGWNKRLENGRWVPTFPKAKYVMADLELAHWTQMEKDSPASVPWITDSVLGGRVIFEVPPALLRLAQRIEGAAQVLAFGATVPAADFHCPLMSLPRAFGTTVATIPAKVPYLAADSEQVAHWQRRVANLEGARIGLVWASGLRPHQPEAERTRHRKSITLDHFAKLADVPGASFVSLQKGQPAAETSSPPAGLLIYDWTDELNTLLTRQL